MNTSLRPVIACLAAMAFALLFSCSGNSSKKDYAFRGKILENPYKVEYSDPKGRDLTQEIDSMIKNIAFLFDDNSPISFSNKFNDQGTSEITNVHVDFLIRESMEMNDKTGGAFDITFLPLLIHSQQYTVHQLLSDSVETLDSIKRFVDSDLLDFTSRSSSESGESQTLTYLTKKDPRVRIMLGGIYKGYLVDYIAKFLEKKKVKHYYVEYGSNPHVKCSGEMNHEWSVVVKEPSKGKTVGHEKANLIINLGSKGLACSGTEIEAILKEGQLINEYIDPRTGQLVKNDMLNAIVVAPETSTADALATAFMIMGREESQKFIDSHPEIEAILIYLNEQREIETYFTEGLKSKIRKG